MKMLNRPFTIAALTGAAMFGFGVSPSLADNANNTQTNEEYVFADDLTNPLPAKSDKLVKRPVPKANAAVNEPGAIDGSIEERYAKFQAEQKKRVEHFHEVVNRNHMRKYGVKVR